MAHTQQQQQQDVDAAQLEQLKRKWQGMHSCSLLPSLLPAPPSCSWTCMLHLLVHLHARRHLTTLFARQN